MKKDKNQLKRSKLIRSLQLLDLAKQNNRINETSYERNVEKLQQKISKLEENTPGDQENYLVNAPIPGFLEKERVGQSEAVSSSILKGVALKFFVIVIAFLAIAYFSPYAFALSMKEPYYLLVAIICPFIYLVIVYMLDKYEPEPKSYVLGAFMWGAISTVIALFLNAMNAGFFGLFLSICLAGVTEELAKGIGIYHLSKNPEYNDTLDAIVYGFAAGLGFAAVENIFYYYQFMNIGNKADGLLGSVVTMVAIRSSLCALGHAVFTTTLAIILAQAKQKKGMPDLGDFVTGYIFAALIHGAFNYFCLVAGNYSIAINSIIVFVGLFIFWQIIRNNWSKVRGWGWHLTVKNH